MTSPVIFATQYRKKGTTEWRDGGLFHNEEDAKKLEQKHRFTFMEDEARVVLYVSEEALSTIARGLLDSVDKKPQEVYCKDCDANCSLSGDRWTCPNGHPHPDGSYSYLCGSDYCRCSQ